MLRGLLILMTIQWAGGCLCYGLARYGGTGSLILAWVLGGFAFVVSFVAPTDLAQFVTLFAIAMVCLNWKRPSIARFGLLGIVGSVLAVGAVGYYAQSVWGNVARKFPVESLADRLAYETSHRPATLFGPVSANTSPVRPAIYLPSADGLQKLDSVYGGGHRYRLRSMSLQLAHSAQLERFMNIEKSFGVSRMPKPSPEYAEPDARPRIRFPDVKLVCSDDQLAAPAAPLMAPAGAWTERFHAKALVNFANFAGWGYVQDREHVAGFESHRFEDVPVGPDQQWQTIRVELVSLLKHDQPMVYISEYLPAMDELRDAPVRPLDAFEERSLAVIVQGGEIEAEAMSHNVRMLGAIRAADKCLQCHTVEHGALLGAFSYVLLPIDFVRK